MLIYIFITFLVRDICSQYSGGNYLFCFLFFASFFLFSFFRGGLHHADFVSPNVVRTAGASDTGGKKVGAKGAK